MTINKDITLFNSHLDKETRREIYIPTVIAGVSFYYVKSSSGQGFSEENIDYKIRIPITADIQNGRTYLPEENYKILPDDEARKYWTIQKSSVIVPEPIIDDSGIYELGTIKSSYTDVISVVEYADNTVRGTDAVKHWRIGGA